MAIPRSDLAQILSRHAIQAIDRLAVLARSYQQFVERRPVIAPVEIEANSLPEFFLVNLPPPPLIKNMLVARKDGLHAQHQGAISGLRTLFEQDGRTTLRRRQRVIVTDKDTVCAGNRGL